MNKYEVFLERYHDGMFKVFPDGKIIGPRGNDVGFIDGRGYKRISIQYNNKWVQIFNHRIIAMIHLNNCIPIDEDLVINHKDFNKLNNDISNLEIITNVENINHYCDSTNKNYHNSGGNYTNMSTYINIIKLIQLLLNNNKISIKMICEKLDIDESKYTYLQKLIHQRVFSFISDDGYDILEKITINRQLNNIGGTKYSEEFKSNVLTFYKSHYRVDMTQKEIFEYFEISKSTLHRFLKEDSEGTVRGF